MASAHQHRKTGWPSSCRRWRVVLLWVVARVPAVPEPIPAQVTAPSPMAPGRSQADGPGRTIADDTEQHAAASAASQSAAARRLQPRHKAAATTLPTYQRRGEWRLSRTHCVGSSPATTPTGGAPTRRRTSATRRRITGPVVLASITRRRCAVARSGKTPRSSTPPRVNERHW